MGIYVIAAMDLNRVIGRNNDIPWNSKVDMCFFRELTEGHCVAMGRKTFESLPGLLKNRKHLVVSSNSESISATNTDSTVSWFQTPNALVGNYLCFENKSRDLWIIGGSEIYRQAIHWNCLDGLVLTRILDTVVDDPTNVRFPEIPGEDFYVADRLLLERSDTKLVFELLLKDIHEHDTIGERFYAACEVVKELAKSQPTLYAFK